MPKGYSKGRVRSAVRSDVCKIYKIIWENPTEVILRPIADVYKNLDRFLIYEEQGKVIGVISYQFIPGLNTTEGFLEIISLSVKKTERLRGIGTILVEDMLKYLKRFGVDRVLVLTFSPGFFKYFGFKKVNKKMLNPKIYTGCLNCTKYSSPLNCPEIAMIKKIKVE